MSRRKVTFLGRSSYHPAIQALAVLVIAIAGVTLGTVGPEDANTEWYIASTMLLFFACGNPIMGLFRKNWKRYVLISIPAFLILGALLLLFTNSIALNGLRSLAEFQQYFLALTVFYFLAVFLTGIFRLVLNFIKSIE